MKNATDETRIDARHLRLEAIVYARQSSPDQVRSHSESTRLQRGLVERARALGWPGATVIDEDLGVSASGLSERSGFQRMLAQVATRKVGILLCLDASRLSRNSPDWAHLFHLCGHFDTLVSDLGQVYDLSIPNDRLVLGVKAVISEMELATLRVRLQEGIKSKASRGELVFMLPAGYVHDHAGRIVKDPDQRVQAAIVDLFTQFQSATSIRQLALRYQETGTRFPVCRPQGRGKVQWLTPTYETLRKGLTNPLHAGAYVWGRKRYRVEYVDGLLRKRLTRRVPIEEAKVFIRDHHEGYISWQQYQANQAKIAENRARRSMPENRGAIREGPVLLAGLLRCGHCGRKLRVAYGTRAAVYVCRGAAFSKHCLSIGTAGLDRAVSEELCRAIEPVAVEAALEAEALHERDQQHRIEQAELQVQAAKYEVDRAMEQYDLIDPKNRLVADTLEERLNQRLAEHRSAGQRLSAVHETHDPLVDRERASLMELATRFSSVWDDPSADLTLRKKIVRAAIEEAIVTHHPEEECMQAVIHWKGGVHTMVRVRKRRVSRGSKADPDLVVTVRDLAGDGVDDTEAARALNLNKLLTPRGLAWTQERVSRFRKQHGIVLRQRESEVLSANQAADYLETSRSSINRMEKLGLITRNQVLPYAPWRIERSELDSEPVRSAVTRLQTTGRLPAKGECSNDQLALFPEETPKKSEVQE